MAMVDLIEMVKTSKDPAMLKDLTDKAEALEEKIEETKAEKASSTWAGSFFSPLWFRRRQRWQDDDGARGSQETG